MVLKKNFEKQIEFTKLLVNTFWLGPLNVNVGVVTYGSTANVEINLVNGKEIKTFTKMISTLRYGYNGNSRCVNQGLLTAYSNIFSATRPGALKAVVLLTSGPSCSSWNAMPLYQVTRLMRERFIQTFVVGIGKQITRNELQKISSPADIFQVNSYDNLGDVVASLSARVCEGT